MQGECRFEVELSFSGFSLPVKTRLSLRKRERERERVHKQFDNCFPSILQARNLVCTNSVTVSCTLQTLTSRQRSPGETESDVGLLCLTPGNTRKVMFRLLSAPGKQERRSFSISFTVTCLLTAQSWGLARPTSNPVHLRI